LESARDLRLEVGLVSSFVRTAMRECAEIPVVTDPGCQPLVGYPDEKTLRDFPAAPGTWTPGYHFREEAQASIDRSTTTTHPSRRRLTPRFVAYSMLSLRKLVSGHLLANGQFSLVKTQSVFCDLLEHAFVAAVVVFYSKNVLSAAIRALISF
jgi:hypothetical protein